MNIKWNWSTFVISMVAVMVALVAFGAMTYQDDSGRTKYGQPETNS
jgi:hypothetical protein